MKNIKMIGLIFIINFNTSAEINKVVLWGHKLHSHTHSYIHYGFFKAFKYLGYDTYWFDNNDDISDVDFSNTLFITEGQVDKGIPLINDDIYILHHCDVDRYLKVVDKSKIIKLCAYVKSCEFGENNQKMTDYVFYNINDQVFYMPWATDILPYEINLIKESLILNNLSNSAVFVGSNGGRESVYGNLNEIDLFKKACSAIGLDFILTGGYGNSLGMIDNNNATYLIKNAYLSPAIQGKWQCDVGYIPCRIFKNISYGKLGITNSKTVYELFNKKIVYNPDCYQLCLDAHKRMKNITQEELFEQMDFVRDNHTYLNRIGSLLKFICIISNI